MAAASPRPDHRPGREPIFECGERVVSGDEMISQIRRIASGLRVVGRPDEDSGEAVHAFVVPAPGRTPSIPELRALVAQRLGPKAVPATVTLIDAVPVAPSGKPDKNALQVP